MKTVLITGCSTGFGRALVTSFLERGWTVVATLRGADGRKNLFDEDARKYGDNLHILSLDVAEAGERRAVVEFVKKRFGTLDLLVNNAGYGLFGALEDVSEEELRRIMEVNFFGAAFLTRDLLPLLRKARGKVLMISSVMGSFGMPLSMGYAASKFALEGLSECLYYELKPLGIQVCLVKPGRHRTGFSRNMQWGKTNFSPDSPYAAQVRTYHRRKEALSARKGISQEKVVRTILRLAEARTIPLRCHIGADAWIVKAMQTFLPERCQTALLSLAWKAVVKLEKS